MEQVIEFLGCSTKAWILKPCDDDSTYPKNHIFYVPNTETATVHDSQGEVTGDGTEKIKRIFEMRCFELLTGISLHKGPENSGKYTLQCPTCKANFFTATKISPSKTENNVETTTMFSFRYDCYHKEENCHSSQINWKDSKAHGLVNADFDTALIGALTNILLPLVQPWGNLHETAIRESNLGFYSKDEKRKLKSAYDRLQRLLPTMNQQLLYYQTVDGSSVLRSSGQIMFLIFQAAFKKKSESNSRAAQVPKKKKLNSSDNASGCSGLEATVPSGTSKRKRSPLPSSTQGQSNTGGEGDSAEEPTSDVQIVSPSGASNGSPAVLKLDGSGEDVGKQKDDQADAFEDVRSKTPQNIQVQQSLSLLTSLSVSHTGIIMEEHTTEAGAEASIIPSEPVIDIDINDPALDRYPTFTVRRKAAKRSEKWYNTLPPQKITVPLSASSPHAEDVPARKRRRLEDPAPPLPTSSTDEATNNTASANLPEGLPPSATSPSTYASTRCQSPR
jgi:hypothetical protein